MLFVSIFACLPYKLPDPRLAFIACILTPCISSGNPTTAPFENHVITHQLLYVFSTFSSNCLTFLPSLEPGSPFLLWKPGSPLQQVVLFFSLHLYLYVACVLFACSVTQCSTLLNAMGCRLPGSSVHGIFQQESWRGLPFPTPGVYSPTLSSLLFLLHFLSFLYKSSQF